MLLLTNKHDSLRANSFKSLFKTNKNKNASQQRSCLSCTGSWRVPPWGVAGTSTGRFPFPGSGFRAQSRARAVHAQHRQRRRGAADCFWAARSLLPSISCRPQQRGCSPSFPLISARPSSEERLCCYKTLLVLVSSLFLFPVSQKAASAVLTSPSTGNS